ncbi:MAG: twin-arginine translocase TatA/TatE family subunit [Dehalococcoidia bacterium]
MGSFGIGIGELLLILLLALLVVGPNRLQDVARGLGKALRQVNKYSSGVTAAFQDEFEKEIADDSRSRSASADRAGTTTPDRTSELAGSEGPDTTAPSELP